MPISEDEMIDRIAERLHYMSRKRGEVWAGQRETIHGTTMLNQAQAVWDVVSQAALDDEMNRQTTPEPKKVEAVSGWATRHV